MTRSSIIITLIIAGILLIAVLTGGGELPGLTDRTAFKNLNRGDVMFPHERHHEWGISCFHCHHRSVSGGENVTYEDLVPGSPAVSCIACHGKGRELERVHHRMCISCHKMMKKKGTDAGPVICGRCHVKKEK